MNNNKHIMNVIIIIKGKTHWDMKYYEIMGEWGK